MLPVILHSCFVHFPPLAVLHAPPFTQHTLATPWWPIFSFSVGFISYWYAHFYYYLRVTLADIAAWQPATSLLVSTQAPPLSSLYRPPPQPTTKTHLPEIHAKKPWRAIAKPPFTTAPQSGLQTKHRGSPHLQSLLHVHATWRPAPVV